MRYSEIQKTKTEPLKETMTARVLLNSLLLYIGLLPLGALLALPRLRSSDEWTCALGLMGVLAVSCSITGLALGVGLDAYFNRKISHAVLSIEKSWGEWVSLWTQLWKPSRPGTPTFWK